jgi:hypothetical protein
MGEARRHRSVIFVDGSMPRSVADELKAIGKEAIAKIEIFPDGTKDPIWLRKVGENGWLAITRDDRIRFRPGEKQAIIDHRVGCFIFTYKNTLKKHEIVELVLKHIEKMETAFATTRRPFIYTIATDGQLRKYV